MKALGWAETAIEDVEADARANHKRADMAPAVADHALLAAHLLRVGATAMRREAQHIRQGEMSDETLADIGILNLALDLHASVTGASDPMPAENMRAVTAYLQRRLDGWKPPPFPFDDAVRRVVEVAVAEATGQIATGRLAPYGTAGVDYLRGLLKSGARWVGDLLDRMDAHGSAPQSVWREVETWRRLAEREVGTETVGRVGER